MSQLSKSEQSRLNGTKSQGPTTPEGKQKSSLNSLKHGLFSNIIVLPTDSSDAYETLRADLHAEHQPTTPQQTELVELISAAHWRLRRLIDIESTLMYHHMSNLEEEMERTSRGDDQVMKYRHYVALAFEELSKTPALEALSRHESRLSTQISRLVRTLTRLKAQEAPKPPSPTTESLPIPEPAPPQPQSLQTSCEESSKRTQHEPIHGRKSAPAAPKHPSHIN